MNKMNTENEELKKKIEMLTELNKQEKSRFIWSAKKKKSIGDNDEVNIESDESKANNRKFGSSGVIIPSTISQKIAAHQGQATCLR